MHGCKETTKVWGKNHSERMEGTIPRAHTGLGIVPVPTSWSGKTHNAQGISKVFRRVCLSMGKISPRLNATLVLSNKA